MKRSALRLIGALTACALAASLASTRNAAAAASGDSSGAYGLLVLLSEAQSARLDGQAPRLAGQGCAVWRHGPVLGANGTLEIGATEWFALLACSEEILGRPDGRAALDAVFGPDGRMRVLQGRLLARDREQTAPAVQSARAYVLKIGRYNNLDPAGRDRDLARINALAAERTDAWQTEGLIDVQRSIGMARPDEVVVIRYDDPAQGQRFRESNLDVLRQIGAFNQRHLVEFTYLSATIEQADP